MRPRHPRLLFGPDASILVTGASSGIGAAIAQHLASYGGKIALFARRHERLERLAQQLATAGASPLILAGDTTDPDAVRQAHAQLVQSQGPVDVAFLNAGVGDSFALRNFRAARVKRVFEVNVVGVAYWLEQLLRPMLARRQGTLVGVSSLAASRGSPMSGAYCASKAALSTLMESIRVEARREGIHVCTVEPGFIRSEMTDKNKFRMPFLMDAQDAATRICEAVADGRPMVRFPWQMAAVTRLARTLPIAAYDWLAGRMIRQEQGETPKIKNG